MYFRVSVSNRTTGHEAVVQQIQAVGGKMGGKELELMYYERQSTPSDICIQTNQIIVKIKSGCA